MSKHGPRSTKRRAGQQQQQDRELRARRIDEVFQRATAAHRGGDLVSAKRLYGEIIARDKQHADAWHLLGFAEFHSQRFHEAIQHLQRAISLRPENGEYHHNLALALLACEQLEEATGHVRQAIALGYQDASPYLQVASELYRLEKLAAAEAGVRFALEVDHRNAAGHYFLGIIRQAQGRLDDAISAYEKALAERPTYAEALNNLGHALRLRGSYHRSAATLQEALLIDPTCVEARANLGATCHEMGHIDRAVVHFQAAHGAKPTSPEILVKLAAALTAQNQLAAAQHCYAKLQQLQPDQKLWSLCEATLCPTVFASAAESDRRWHDMERAVDRLADGSLAISQHELLSLAPPPPFTLQFFPGNLRPVKERFAAVYRSTTERLNEELSRPAAVAGARTDARIRIGFVVTPGKEGVFLRSMQGVIERLDVERFAPAIVCWQPSVSILEQAFQQPHISRVVMPSQWKQLAPAVQSQALDILYYFEIGTDAANYFLPFLRLAPMQCTSWGIQVTSGIPNVDHYLSSRLVEPPDAADHYSERLALAETLLCYRTRTPLPLAPKSRAQFGFTPSQNLYVCAQQLGKFHTDFDPMIGAILRQDARGVLAVTGDRSGVAARRLRERFSATMPDVADRIVMLPHLERDEYRSLLLAADVLLDPPHFGGVNSTYDGLSYGKPIVTLPSGFHRGRYTLGCYRKLQLEDCVTSSVEEYVELAGRLARDANLRDHLCKRIHATSPALFEDAAAVTEHERLFEELQASDRRD